MDSFFLDLDANIKGIYLSSEMIDLLSVIQCKSIDELYTFALNCPQLVGIDVNSFDWSGETLEELKQAIFKAYQETLVSLKDSVDNRENVIKNVLRNVGLPEDDFESIISPMSNLDNKNNVYAEITKRLYEMYPKEYSKIAQNQHRFIATERDQIKDVTFEEMCAINDKLQDSNTILVASGRYDNTKNKLYLADIERHA